MKLKLIAFAAAAALTVGADAAQAADQPLVEAKNKILVATPTTPQVAYPPKCGNPIFPRYCRRW